MRKIVNLIIILSISGFLQACGGGGSGTTTTSTSFFGTLLYPSENITIFQQKTILPSLGGFEGRAARCDLISGAVPTGMSLIQDCSISGIPTSVGIFSFSFKLTAAGIASETTGRSTVTVVPPNLSYKYYSANAINGTFTPTLITNNDVISDTPVINSAFPWPHISLIPVVWKFQITSGDLPPGLKIDSITGVISGQPTQEGSYKAFVGATVTSRLGDLVIPGRPYFIDVMPLVLKYSYNGASNAVLSDFYVGWPYSNAPSISPAATNGVLNLLSNFSLSATSKTYGTAGTAPVTTIGIPAGLVINSATGIISGIPQAQTKIYSFAKRYDNSVEFTVSATVNRGNLPPIPITTKFIQYFELPFYYYFGESVVSYSFSAIRGSPLVVSPVVKMTSTPVSTQPIVRFANENSTACPWDFGLAVNPVSGSITGIPTKIGKFDCNVLATVALNGVTWIQSIPTTFDIK